jgi:hypothetical protein
MATPGFYNEQDQNIYDNVSKFMPQSKYLLSAPTFTAPTTEEEKVTETFGIPNTNAFTNSGGGGGYYPGSPNTLIGNFNSIVDARQKRLNNPSDTFLGFNTMKDQEMTTMGKIRDFFTPQSASQIMSDGYREPRFQPGIIATIMGKFDNFRNLPQADQAFIAQNMGYTGPTIFGENNSGLGKDPFGINTRSMFGNYAQHSRDMADEEGDLAKQVADQIARGLTNTIQMKQLAFHQNLQKEQKQRIEDKKAADLKAFEDQKARSGITSGANDGRYENINDRDRGGQGAFAEDKTSMKSAGKSYKDAQGNVGYSRGRKDGGRIDYKHGGLASIL